MRGATAVLAVLALVFVGGCGGGASRASTPREESMRSTFEGSYQVKGTEDGKTQGVGIYADGSFRIVLEDSARMVIFDAASGEGWLVSLARKTYEPISEDEALLKAGFMPHQVMRPYFSLEEFWDGPEFRMDTFDGRSIRAFLGGPGFLPSDWTADAQDRPIKKIEWEYSRVGEVSPDNFRLPEGLTPAG